MDRQADRFVPQVEGQRPLVFAEFFRRPAEDREKLPLVHRLHQIMEGLHFIPLGNIVGVAGDEDNLDRVVFPADLAGHRHPVHPAHLDVQEEDLEPAFRFALEEEALGRREGFQLEGVARRFPPAAG